MRRSACAYIGHAIPYALGAGLALLGPPARAAWIEARTDHFIVYSDDDPARVRTLATRLERFDKAIRTLHALPEEPSDRANPLTVYVVPDVAAVQRLCNGLEGQKQRCTNIAGFYDGRADGSVAFMPRHAGSGGKLELNSQIVLFHEYSHHIMLANYSGAYPAWYVEGFAEFNSTASFATEGKVGFGKPALHRYYALFTASKPLKLADLLTASGATLKPEQRESLYGRGWLLTHYLTFEPARKGQLETYLAAINKGKSSLEAAKAAFGDLAALDRELDGYMKRSKLSYWDMKVAGIADDAVTVRPLTPGEAAMMPVRLRSDRGVDGASAALVVADARRRAATFPDDSGAQDVLAEAEYDAGNDDQAEAAADRALAAAPKDRTAMLYKGRVLVRRAEQAGSRDGATWQQARKWFVKANRAEPDAAAPLYLYYQSFLSEGARPPAIAVKGLEKAFSLAPQDGGLRYTLARQYLVDHRLADARATLAPLAFDPHAPPDNPAATLIALIDRDDTKAILARLGDKADHGDDAGR